MSNRLQPVYDIAALCAAQGVRQAVLCPGSRNAPLTLAFARHPEVTCWSISDERSAAFVALGIARQLNRPAVLVSTSGTAAYNFAPAVAEAYFARIPLIVITADRPTEWVGQQDGQTIFQYGLFGHHAKRAYQLTQTYDHPDDRWAINRIVNETINVARQEPAGPVHINVPLREPLYPENEGTSYSSDIRVINDIAPVHTLNPEQAGRFRNVWNHSPRVLILAGQLPPDGSLQTSLLQVVSKYRIPLVADVLSNLHTVESAIRRADLFIGACNDDQKQTLRPDLLISLGDGSLSRPLKKFLRDYRARTHWHLQAAGDVADTYQSVTDVVRIQPAAFFAFMDTLPEISGTTHSLYANEWMQLERSAAHSVDAVIGSDQPSELNLVHRVLKRMTEGSLHLANSMSVRYAAMTGLCSSQGAVGVYSNRGTSGIDGCTSTVVGHALVSQTPHVLITGDVAFFYDRNAFWHNYPLPHLRIVVLNNHGGGIFRMIDGPGETKETEEYLVTRQPLTARHLCEELGLSYHRISPDEDPEETLASFLSAGNTAKILELESSIELNINIINSLKKTIKDSL